MSRLPQLPGATVVALSWSDLPGWQDDQLGEALEVFARSAASPHPEATIRAAQAVPEDLARQLERAQDHLGASPLQARRFFESAFQPFRILPEIGQGFLTAYFEPEFAASRIKTDHFSHPLLARPTDLVTFPLGSVAPAPLDPALAAARQTKAGLEPFPTRAAIEEGALAGENLEMAWLDPVDLFFMQVQGSGRLTFADGTRTRFAYAGRNGRPYTSIGKVMVAEGHMPLEIMTLEALMGWLKAHPDQARRIMQLNQSYVFFRRLIGLDETQGPIGGAGIPLTPHRSIAVDRSLWPYGLPFWLDTSLPETLATRMPLRRLMIAQDTGSAILGPARADYFMGTGAEAGRRAGLVRQMADFMVLWPKEAS